MNMMIDATSFNRFKDLM